MWAIVFGVLAAILILLLIGGCAYCETRPSSAMYRLEARLNNASSADLKKNKAMHPSSVQTDTKVPKTSF